MPPFFAYQLVVFTTNASGDDNKFHLNKHEEAIKQKTTTTIDYGRGNIGLHHPDNQQTLSPVSLSVGLALAWKVRRSSPRVRHPKKSSSSLAFTVVASECYVLVCSRLSFKCVCVCRSRLSWSTTMTISSKMFVLLVSTMVVGVCLDVPSMAIGLELKPYCGFPGKPYRAKIMPEEKLVFLEGESVMYQCADYWAPPQSKKCVNGQWVGPVVRCGDFVSDLLMRDSRLVDVATGEEKFHYTNMNITSTDWKYPNSFTSNRFRKARLRALDDHPYRWTFNFSKPAVKLYCKLNFNFINFSLQSEEFKKEFRFNLNISISPHRICKLEYQSYNPWRQEGNRIDSYFICEANSLQALQAELADPPNALEIRTKASHKLTHELIAVFFGRVYGTDKEPLCGEPELEYGQAYRPNQEFRDYMIDCANRHEWQDMNPPGVKSFNYVNRCFGDMRWNGTRPHCQPKQSCPMSKVNQEYRTGMYNTTHHDNLVIDSISKFYFEQEEDTVYATAGTEIIYTCQSEDYVLIGKDTRVCKENFKWSGTEPVCKCKFDEGKPNNN